MLRFSPFKALAMGLAATLASWAGTAQAQALICGITGSASAAPAFYDPFNPSGLVATTITLNLTRKTPASGGEKTAVVNFYLRSSNSNANGASLVPTSVVIVGGVAGLNKNIFYNNPGSVPTVAPTSLNPIPPDNFLKLSFTGSNVASNTAQVTFQVTLPTALNLNAVSSLGFDAIFACSTTGGGSPTEQTGFISNAVVFPITVLSALQASYAGVPLDFGEIGTVTTTQVTATPASFSTPISNHVRVQSSGPYQVDLSSANAFRLKHPSGSLTVPAETVQYNLKFLGQNRNFGSSPTPGATAITQTCARAGVGIAFEDSLGIQGTLLEGGQGKTPSPSYSDTLTVTVTPLAALTAAPIDCAT